MARGPYKRDLDFLVGALQNGLDPMSGINLYQGFQAERDARQQARQEALLAQQQAMLEAQSGQRDFLQELASTAIDRAREGASLESLLPELQVQMQVAGIGPKMQDDYLGAAGLGTLYPGGAGMSPTAPVSELFDDEDAKAVWTQAAALAQQNIGRADARQQIGSAIKQTLGEAAYLNMRHLMDDAINKAYAGIAIA
jgi:hypothetical protein